jgi:hypothetical protein
MTLRQFVRRHGLFDTREVHPFKWQNFKPIHMIKVLSYSNGEEYVRELYLKIMERLRLKLDTRYEIHIEDLFTAVHNQYTGPPEDILVPLFHELFPTCPVSFDDELTSSC